MFELEKIQTALREFELDAWLLYDFRGNNVLARRILNFADDAVGSRRFCFCIPAHGTPVKLVHRIESTALDHLPGSQTVYLCWQEWEAGIASLVAENKTVAMEYSPRNANPYVSRVDAGMVELVQSFGTKVVSSGDLIQLFEATWTEKQWKQHLAAAIVTNKAFARAWEFIAAEVNDKGSVEELEVRQVILDHFAESDTVTSHPPIVAVGSNSGNPHYETGTGERTTISRDDFVLIDLWAKLDEPMSVYSDLTRVGYVDETVPSRYTEIFNIVAAARDAAIENVRTAIRDSRELAGWEVDQAARGVIEKAGFGEQYVHRTGHSIGQETHGNGANIDDLETHEERRIMPSTCFSIEPGIYLPEFGIRSEVNVFIDADSEVHVTGGEIQTEVRPILCVR